MILPFLKNIFDQYDHKLTGYIDAKYLGKILKTIVATSTNKIIFEMPKTVSDMKTLMGLFNADENNKISFPNYLYLAAKQTREKNSAIRLQKEALNNAKKNLTKTQLKVFKDTFNLYDIDNNGTLTSKEFLIAFKAMGHSHIDKQTIEKIIKKYDKDNSGNVSFTEFLLINGKKYREENIRLNNLKKSLHGLTIEQKNILLKSFDKFDIENQGFLTSKDLPKITKAMGIKTTIATYKKLLKELDPNNENKITLISFINIFSKNIKMENEIRIAISEKQLSILKYNFMKYNRSLGGISAQNVKTILKDDLKLAITNRDLQKILYDMKKLYPNNTNIKYDAFLRISSKIIEQYNKKLVKACENLTKKEITMFRNKFDKYDINKQNYITSKELYYLLKDSGKSVTLKDINRLLHIYDTDHNDVIDFAEYLQMLDVQNKAELTKKLLRKAAKGLSKNQLNEIKDAFNKYDKDHDNLINIQEFAEYLKELYPNISNEQIFEIRRKVDANQSGFIELHEFIMAVGQKMKQENKLILADDNDDNNHYEDAILLDLKQQTYDDLSDFALLLFKRAYGKLDDPVVPDFNKAKKIAASKLLNKISKNDKKDSLNIKNMTGKFDVILANKDINKDDTDNTKLKEFMPKINSTKKNILETSDDSEHSFL